MNFLKWRQQRLQRAKTITIAG